MGGDEDALINFRKALIAVVSAQGQGAGPQLLQAAFAIDHSGHGRSSRAVKKQGRGTENPRSHQFAGVDGTGEIQRGRRIGVQDGLGVDQGDVQGHGVGPGFIVRRQAAVQFDAVAGQRVPTAGDENAVKPRARRETAEIHRSAASRKDEVVHGGGRHAPDPHGAVGHRSVAAFPDEGRGQVIIPLQRTCHRPLGLPHGRKTALTGLDEAIHEVPLLVVVVEQSQNVPLLVHQRGEQVETRRRLIVVGIEIGRGLAGAEFLIRKRCLVDKPSPPGGIHVDRDTHPVGHSKPVSVEIADVIRDGFEQSDLLLRKTGGLPPVRSHPGQLCHLALGQGQGGTRSRHGMVARHQKTGRFERSPSRVIGRRHHGVL